MRNILPSAVLILLSLCVSGQRKPLTQQGIQSLKSGVAATASKTSTLTSDFSQEKEMSILQEKILSGGKFYFRKERQLRWEYTHPYSYVVVISNDRISIRDDQKTNSFSMQSNKVFTEINNIILGSIRGTLLNDEINFKASFFEEPGNYVVKLVPVSPKLKEALSGITLWFDRSGYTVNRMEMLEPSGDVTRITFTGQKLNTPIPDETFIIR